MSREALVLLVCCCDFRDRAERLIPSKSLRNAVIRAFPGLFCILRMCAPRRAAAVVRPRGREKSADRRRRILISRLLIIRASVPRWKSPFPVYFKGFPAVSPLIPPYPAFLKYPVSPQGAFSEMYTTGHPCVGSYTMKNGERRVVFTVPIEPVEVDGETYTCIAVSYDNETLEEMIGGHAYNGQSDCYIIYPSGDIMLSEEPKSEIERWMENLFDFLEQNAQVNTNALAKMREDVQNSGRGSVAYRYEGKSYYLVYQPVGFQSLSIVGIVDRSVVDAGMRKIQTATILLLIALMAGIVFTLVRFVRINARQEVEEKEHALRAEASERKKMEGLANSDGLTGLFNERCFNKTLKEKEQQGEPFVLFYLDLDRFKPVNDTYGHDVGDQLLKAVAGRLRSCVRNTDYAFRIGGDEFALIVNGEVDAEWCAQRMETIKSIIRQTYVLEGQTIDISTSCGVICYPADSADVRELRILADQRMYEDKQKTGSSRSIKQKI